LISSVPDLLPNLQHKHDRLLARIHRRYQTRTQSVRYGPVSFNFTRIADPERVLDDVAEEETRRTKIKKDGSVTSKEEPLRMPYWAELWESADAISQWLVENATQERSEHKKSAHSEQDGSSIPRVAASLLAPPPTALDLGCGMGLSGCVAAAVGYDVTFADIEAPALLFAELNALPFPHTTCRKTNWQSDDLGRRFDLIIGADILYERTQWDFLEPFWQKHLAPGGQILLGEPGRPTSETFPTWINSKGYTVTIEKRQVPGREEPIRLILIREIDGATVQIR
jgi:2-polyprenyl-3-methyl-5-hydroxy-6-metoxy-1,4-benzoquinol methylase